MRDKGRHRDHPALRRLFQMRHRGGRQPEKRLDHAVLGLDQRLDIDIAQQPPVGKAGIGDNLVQPTERGQRRLDQMRRQGGIGKVAQLDRRVRTRRPSLSRHGFQPVAITARMEQQLCAWPGDPARRRRADTAGRAGNQDNTVGPIRPVSHDAAP